MATTNLRFVLRAFICMTAIVCSSLAIAQSNSLSVTLSLASLPGTIILCRDPAAIQQFGTDEQWQVPIDIDANQNTGDPSGFDVELLVETATPPYPCSPTMANTQDSLVAGVLVWDSSQQQFVDSGESANVAIDSNASSMTITAGISGVLKNFSSQSSIYAFTAGVYTPTASQPTYADDYAGPATIASAATDPANDVQACSAPCGTGTSWYGLIDIERISASTSAPLPAFGVNTLYIEFDLASLPAMISLCRYPQSFAGNAGASDSSWSVFFNLDGNSGTGDAGGNEAEVSVYTTPQMPACITNYAMFTQALTAELDRFDTNQQSYVYVSNLPVSVDFATGKMTVQADRSASAFSGLSAHSEIAMQTLALYPAPANPAFPPGAFDYIPTYLTLGVDSVAPASDVQNCTMPCSTSASWYPQIDLVGGAVYLTDGIFNDGFE